MEGSKVKDENYYQVQGWMVTKLNLKGNEKDIYAIIYGFSQDGQTRYTGSLQYLADWTNSSKQSVINCLKSLIDKELIVKEEKYINGVKFVEYYSTMFNGGSTKLNGGSQQSLPNNINNNIDNILVVEYEKEIGFLTPFQAEKLFSYLNEVSEEMIIEAIHRASLMNKKSLAYVEGILKKWIRSGYKVVSDIREDKPRTDITQRKEFDVSHDDLDGLYDN